MTSAVPQDGSAADCVFCAIAAGRAVASRLYEDDAFLAFLDITSASLTCPNFRVFAGTASP